MDTILTAAEVAHLLRIHLATVYRLIKNNGLPGMRVGSDWRFSQAAIEKWMKANSENSRSILIAKSDQPD